MYRFAIAFAGWLCDFHNLFTLENAIDRCLSPTHYRIFAIDRRLSKATEINLIDDTLINLLIPSISDYQCPSRV